MNRRIRRLCVLLLLACSLAGCGESGRGQKGADAQVSSNIVEMKKDGMITNTIEEDFASEYYDEQSLKDFIVKEAGRYNGRAGEECITVKKLEVKKGRAKLTMEYRTAEDYSLFNGYPFFCGTIAEAYEKGYNLDVELLDVEGTDDGQSAVTREQLLEMGSRRIVIVQLPETEGSLIVKTGGKILYQAGTESVKKDTAVIAGGGNTPVYIVFK